MEYEAKGGRANKYREVACYFQRASWYVPDDANVLILNGIYRQKLGHDEMAEEYWKGALLIDSRAVEAHYNLGLLYFRLGDFSSSVEHARSAYELGYPLPGLKKKLAMAGYWE